MLSLNLKSIFLNDVYQNKTAVFVVGSYFCESLWINMYKKKQGILSSSKSQEHLHGIPEGDEMFSNHVG